MAEPAAGGTPADPAVPAGALVESEAEFSPQGVKLLADGLEAARRQRQTGAEDLVAQARRVAEKLEKAAESLRSHRDPSAVGEVVELVEQAAEQAQAVVGLLQEAREQADAEVEHGRAQGREIVEQAKTLRLTVLRDMARRRQTARAQVERLRAGRDKLMATLSDARQSIEQSLEAAKLSLAEAKVVADAAARRVEDEAEPKDSALLSELDDARMVGMVGAGEVPQTAETAGTAPERDPVEAAAEHPVLTSADDRGGVDAIFARLRSQSGQPLGSGEIVRDAANTVTGDE